MKVHKMYEVIYVNAGQGTRHAASDPGKSANISPGLLVHCNSLL